MSELARYTLVAIITISFMIPHLIAFQSGQITALPTKTQSLEATAREIAAEWGEPLEHKTVIRDIRQAVIFQWWVVDLYKCTDWIVWMENGVELIASLSDTYACHETDELVRPPIIIRE